MNYARDAVSGHRAGGRSVRGAGAEFLGLSFDAPVFASVDPWALALAGIAGSALFRLKLGVLWTLAICSAASITLHFSVGIA